MKNPEAPARASRTTLRRWPLAGMAALTLVATAFTGPAAVAAEPVQCAPDARGAWQITADCIDPLYAQPVIDAETDETHPVPHHRVAGHFEGTNIQFTFYFHPAAEKAKWK